MTRGRDLDDLAITDRQLIDALARRGYVVADGVIDIDYGASIDYGALQADLAVHELLQAARVVIARWNDDDVNAGLMNRDVARLRQACDEFPSPEAVPS